MVQVEINFEPGLTEQYPTFREVFTASVYGSKKQLKSIAADLDMTSSELSRKLANNPNDPVNFPLHLLPDAIRATGDFRPIYWLIETFIEDPALRRNRAVARLADLLPELQALMKSVQVEESEMRGSQGVPVRGGAL